MPRFDARPSGTICRFFASSRFFCDSLSTPTGGRATHTCNPGLLRYPTGRKIRSGAGRVFLCTAPCTALRRSHRAQVSTVPSLFQHSAGVGVAPGAGPFSQLAGVGWIARNSKAFVVPQREIRTALRLATVACPTVEGGRRHVVAIDADPDLSQHAEIGARTQQSGIAGPLVRARRPADSSAPRRRRFRTSCRPRSRRPGDSRRTLVRNRPLRHTTKKPWPRSLGADRVDAVTIRASAPDRY